MLFSKTVVWLLVLFVGFASSAPSTNKVLGKTFIKHYNVSGRYFTLDDPSYNDTHNVYGLCSGKDYERHCKLNLEPLDSYESLSCNVTVKSSAQDARILDGHRTVILNQDRGLLLTWETYEGQNNSINILLINVNFRDCSTKLTGVQADAATVSLLVNVVAYEDSYDLFYTNSKLCQKRYCKMTFGNDGIFRKSEPWGENYDERIEHLGFMQSAARDSPAKGFTFKKVRQYNPYVLVADKDGKALLTSGPVNDANSFAVSTVGNIIGTCKSEQYFNRETYQRWSTLECKQYDFEGKLVMTELLRNSSSLVGDDRIFRYLERLNLPEGFILLAVLCPENHGGNCAGSETYAAYRLSGNGEKLKAIEIDDFQCKSGIDGDYSPRLYKNAAGQICVSLVCQKFDTRDGYTIGVRCFTNDIL